MDVLGKDIGHLSKGYRQRVGLAQAMVHDPDLLILDEPTSGLDPNQIVEIRELIKDIGREKTVILSTHILPEVQATLRPHHHHQRRQARRRRHAGRPDRARHRRRGVQIVVGVRAAPGRPLGIQSGCRRQRREDRRFVRRRRRGHCRLPIAGQRQRDPREAIFQAAVQHDFVLLDMHRERVSLEDTFRRLTRGEAEVKSLKNGVQVKEVAHG